MRVGFVGLGTMGSSMALNVRAAGYDIVVNDIRREAGAPHLNAGASWGDSARKCVFRTKPATESGAKKPPVPAQTSHRSGPIRPPGFCGVRLS